MGGGVTDRSLVHLITHSTFLLTLTLPSLTPLSSIMEHALIRLLEEFREESVSPQRTVPRLKTLL